MSELEEESRGVARAVGEAQGDATAADLRSAEGLTTLARVVADRVDLPELPQIAAEMAGARKDANRAYVSASAAQRALEAAEYLDARNAALAAQQLSADVRRRVDRALDLLPEQYRDA